MACILPALDVGRTEASLETLEPRTGDRARRGVPRPSATAICRDPDRGRLGFHGEVMNDIALVRSMIFKGKPFAPPTSSTPAMCRRRRSTPAPRLLGGIGAGPEPLRPAARREASAGRRIRARGFLRRTQLEPFVVQEPSKICRGTRSLRFPSRRFRRRLGLLDRLKGAGLRADRWLGPGPGPPRLVGRASRPDNSSRPDAGQRSTSKKSPMEFAKQTVGTPSARAGFSLV